MTVVSRVDRALLRWIVGRRTRPLNAMLIPAAYAGAAGLPWVTIVVLVRLRWRDGDRVPVVRSVVGVLGAWVAAQAVKQLNDRPRPCDRKRVVPLVDCADSPSLPSDQAASAFAGATAIADAIPELALPAYAVAAVTAFSRVYTGVHYPSDAAAGSVLGATVARLLSRPKL